MTHGTNGGQKEGRTHNGVREHQWEAGIISKGEERLIEGETIDRTENQKQMELGEGERKRISKERHTTRWGKNKIEGFFSFATPCLAQLAGKEERRQHKERAKKRERKRETQ